MSDFIKTYSTSMKYKLEEIFNFRKDDIKNFLSSKLKAIFQKEENLNRNLKNFHELKNFLGKKRSINFKIEEIEQEYKTHFINPTSNNDKSSEDISVTQFHYNDNLGFIAKKNNSEITIFKKPLVLTEIYENNSININLVNDSITFNDKITNINKYNYKVYSLDNKDNLLEDTDLQKMTIDENIENNKKIEIEKENIYPYLIFIKSKIPEIKDSDLEFNNIYPIEIEIKNEIIRPENISKIFFYYFNINSELAKDFEYIETKKRMDFYGIMEQSIYNNCNKVIIITGPKGIGKTTSLIRFSFIKLYRVFYFNLESFQRYSYDSKELKIKELKIQLTKLFGLYVKYDNEKVKQKIEKYIDKNSDENCFKFIYNIIKLFLTFVNNVNVFTFCFIIDQYSLNYKNTTTESEINIKNIIELCKTSNKIKLVICPTINNLFSKEQINYLFSGVLNEENSPYLIYYFQELIPKEKIIEKIINKESDENKNFIEELGYIPKFFYELKNININIYKNYLEINLRKNIKEYYSPNDNTEMNMKILNILDLTKSEKLISSYEFQKNISIYPLKYLKIIKYKVNQKILDEFSKKNKINNNNKEEDIIVQYLRKLLKNEKNKIYDLIIKNYFKLEEKDLKEYLDNYIEKDKSSINIYGNYYKDFIDSYSDYFDTKFLSDIYVYKLEFNMIFIEAIFLDYLFLHLKGEYKLFLDIIDKGACGGFFEILVDYYIQSKKNFIVSDIKNTFYIPSLVPQNYSIKYYSYSRNNNNFKEFKLTTNEKKKKIPFENTYIRQTTFNSKYYDMAILIKTNKPNTFNLSSVQATIHKDKEKRMTKDEHELILGSTKQNLENQFDITIDKAYFFYVLSKKNGNIEDQETKKECDENKIQYIGFDIDNIDGNTNKYLVDYNKAFITESFPTVNCASILYNPKKDDTTFFSLKKIIEEKLKDAKSFDNNNFNYIAKLLKNKYGKDDILINQLKYIVLKINKALKSKITQYLTHFSFLIIEEEKNKKTTEKIYMYFMNEGYDLKNCSKLKSIVFKNISYNELKFCFSTIPLKSNI